jgi:hypothetical protein
MWSIAYEASEECFVARPAQSIRFHQQANKFVFSAAKSPNSSGAKIVFAGDRAVEARNRLASLLDSKYTNADEFQGLNWEPFEVIRDMLRDPNHSETIGGAPQVVKVYQYFQTAPLAVYWPDRASGHTLSYKVARAWSMSGLTGGFSIPIRSSPTIRHFQLRGTQSQGSRKTFERP